ncbi:uncharacterized protein LOC129309513 [Prosopis cineraria]|uniref:uncharacterized protein LOC129309513 n=1 Tax=Prosopis cineraria TaxID=364024 RepID=UPI00240EFF9A|nr:uncharacterized protein LOC129309513 [Prosopis cineraria]
MPSSSSPSSPLSLSLIHPLNATPRPPPPLMDWLSWLSRTNLESSLIYDYGVTFARNQLELQDAAFFNHEFLQSMGVSIAKHRLEILKLAHNDYGAHLHHHRPRKLSGVIKNYIRKCVRKLVVFREEDRSSSDQKEFPGGGREPDWYYHEKWRGAVERKPAGEEFQKPVTAMNRTRRIALSGPLDGRTMNEKMVNSNKVLRLSGPLDGKKQERWLYTNRSPVASGRPMMGSMKSPRSSGPLDPRLVMTECKSPRFSRPSDARPQSPMSFSPCLNKTKGDFDFDEDDHTLWPTLFQDLKPT